MTSVTAFSDEHLTTHLNTLIIPDQVDMKMEIGKGGQTFTLVNDGVCAICLDDIQIQETALIKGCEHAYCVNCILQWATYHEHPKCPQCKNPFECLSVHRGLDGSLHDYMLEESVCLLVRASWFKPLDVEHQPDFYDDTDDIFFHQYQQYSYEYEDIDEELEDSFFHTSTSLRIGNRRWGDNGYIRGGRLEARPAHRSNPQTPGGSSSARQPKQKEVKNETQATSSSTTSNMNGAGKGVVGRRAKRALKREAADKAAAAKHQQHLIRLGRQ